MHHLRKILANVLLLFFSIFIAVFLANIIIVTCVDYEYGRLGNIRRAAKKQGVHFDERTRLEVIAQLESEGKKVAPPMGVNFVDAQTWQDQNLLPLGGVSQVETVLCNENGQYAVYRGDRYGFNNSDTVWNIRSDRNTLILGDSFAHGACVDADESTQAALTAMGFPTISLGIGGNGPLAALAALREYGDEFAPKNVVYLFYEGNDLLDLERELQLPQLRKYLDEEYGQHLPARQNEVDHVLGEIISRDRANASRNINNNLLLSKILRMQGVTEIWRTFRRTLSERLGVKLYKNTWKSEKELGQEEKIAREHFLDVVAYLQRETERIGASFYFVYIPDYITVNKNRTETYNLLKPLLVGHVNFIDFYQFLKDDPSTFANYPFGQAGHFNQVGYKNLAGYILERIEK